MKLTRMFIPLVLILLTACGSNVTEPVSAPATSVPPTEAPATVANPTSTDEVDENPTALPAADEAPIQTEEQAILSSFSQPATGQGELLILYGHVLDESGQPLNGYAVEIWQVDANGSYDHPNDPSTGNRDRNFQFYGTSLTDENGLFAFRTIVPARYEPRPRHIHFKVKKDGQTVLTSQFYIAGDVNIDEMLLLDLRDVQDANSNTTKLAFKDIVINTGSGGNLSPTQLQQEGPYYPVMDVSAFDNDLASVR